MKFWIQLAASMMPYVVIVALSWRGGEDTRRASRVYGAALIDTAWRFVRLHHDTLACQPVEEP